MNETTLRVNFRTISIILAVIIVGMLGIWRPWNTVTGQTISVTGEASVKGTPDEFIFSPTYQKSATTSVDAISAVSKVGNGVIDKLKELGVAEKNIRTTTNSNPDYSKQVLGIPEVNDSISASGYLATYSLTVTISDKALAQKTLDYLITTSPIYGVSPQSTFSSDTRKDLESQARAKAIGDAKTKAAQSAIELDSKVGRVISVSEPQWGGPIPFALEGKAVATDLSAAPTSPVLLTGEEPVTYSVTVVFRLR